MKPLVLAAALLFCTCPGLVLSADQENNNGFENNAVFVNLSVNLPEEVTLGLVYTSLFRITNLNHTKGFDSFINVSVYYNITRDSTLVYEGNFTRLVNSFATSSTGYLFINEPGEYLLCGKAVNSENNASACKNFTVIDPLEVGCDARLGLEVDNFIIENNERLEFRNILDLQGNETVGGSEPVFIIEYWIEDLFGKEVKGRVNTSNTNAKSFTPGIDEADAFLIAKNRLVFIGCNNTSRNTTSEAFFAVKNTGFAAQVAKETSSSRPSESTSSNASREAAPTAKIVSFYTRTKKFKPKINVYANIKSGSDAVVVLKESAGEQWRKISGNEKLTFEASAVDGENYYLLELLVDEVVVDSKSLVVVLAPSELSAKAKLFLNKTNTLNITNKTATTAVASPGSISKQSAGEPAVLNESEQGANSQASLSLNPGELGLENGFNGNAAQEATSGSGMAVYKSTGEKASEYAPHVLISGMALLVLALLFKKSG